MSNLPKSVPSTPTPPEIPCQLSIIFDSILPGDEPVGARESDCVLGQSLDASGGRRNGGT
jgi:hypothetical protein